MNPQRVSIRIVIGGLCSIFYMRLSGYLYRKWRSFEAPTTDVLYTFFFIAVNRYLFASVTDIREPSVHDLVPE